MQRNRLEAFSDGVLAILITIMVLELRFPEQALNSAAAPITRLDSLKEPLLSYVMSFIALAIYWNNHHHLLHTVNRVTGRILWANMHLLFWLSLIPFTTHWLSIDSFDPVGTSFYGVVLVLSGISYKILQTQIIREHGQDHVLAQAVGKDYKGIASVLVYLFGIVASSRAPWIGLASYGFVSLLWLVPDRRIESRFAEPEV
ncbi:MAG: TMEM175 family protein [Fimbriimonadaceae bacterium]